MTKTKVRKVLALYRKVFKNSFVPEKKFSEDEAPFYDEQALAHCHATIAEMEIFLKEGRMDEVFRWLGFIQGCLWTAGLYTLEELKNHSRP